MTGTTKLYLLIGGIVISVLAGCASVKETRKQEETVTIREREVDVPVPGIVDTFQLVPVEPPSEDAPIDEVPILTVDEPSTPSRPAVRGTVTRNRLTGEHRLELSVDPSTAKAKVIDTERSTVLTIDREHQPPWYERVWDWVQNQIFYLILALAAVGVLTTLWKKHIPFS